MKLLAADNPVMARFANRGRALTLLKRRLQADRAGGLNEKMKKQAKENEFTKSWSPEKATDDETKSLLNTLQAEQDKDLEELTTLVQEATNKGGDTAAVELLKKAEDAHGKMSDEELDAAIKKLEEEVTVLRDKVSLLAIDRNRRQMVKSLTEKLNVKTGMDRAILDRVLNPGVVPTKTKINPPK